MPRPNKRKTWKGKELIPGDTAMQDSREDDIIIPVMGPTGVGKSTFINTLAGREAASVGHELKSHTSTIQCIIVSHPQHPTRRIILVDTPGFDDTYVQDSEILRLIAVWLAKSYREGMKLAGIVYLHDICQRRMFGTSRMNIVMFNKLCGENVMKNVILATTGWDDIQKDVGLQREEQLAKLYWKHMLDLESRMSRFLGSSESAWDIIRLILTNPAKPDAINALQIQEELVEIGKLLPETDAGRTLRYTLKELLEIQRNTAEQLRKEVGTQEELEKKLAENDNQIRSILLQIKDLRIPISRRIMASFGIDGYIAKIVQKMHPQSIVPPINHDMPVEIDTKDPLAINYPEVDNPGQIWDMGDHKFDGAIMGDPREDDIVIPIIGPTGVGKSTFINLVLDSPVMSVGHGLESHTSAIQYTVYNRPTHLTRRVVLVDTPGFSNTFIEDAEIPRRIAAWLAQSYNNKTKLSGIIYLHDISLGRIFGISQDNIMMLTKLCGNTAMKNVILATTKWEGIEDAGKERERQLAEGEWKYMIDLGSQVHRLSRTPESQVESARKAVELILQNVDQCNAVDYSQNQHLEIKESADTQKDIAEPIYSEGGSSQGDYRNIKSSKMSKRIAAFFGI